MAIDLNRFNPFLAQTQGFNPKPLSPVPATPQKEASLGLIGASNPFNQASFAGLKGRTDTGLSFLRTDPGQTGLGDKAIQTPDGQKLGAKLFVSI